ncbi:hypothetical protein VMCG_04020 [Cytospora schulzeri]|uniref:Uncharacterized protein n=1 Tax=Cytospora schulzeri TaxID=448051 RepID=A0A423WTF5_9PEZI|nr:hypothetical protein VMCG_04020 [Valsa malicola]
MTSFETTRTNSSYSASASSQHEGGLEDQQTRLNPWTGRPLRNSSPYGRHSNDWLFGSVAVKKSIKKGVKKVLLRGAQLH